MQCWQHCALKTVFRSIINLPPLAKIFDFTKPLKKFVLSLQMLMIFAAAKVAGGKLVLLISETVYEMENGQFALETKF